MQIQLRLMWGILGFGVLVSSANAGEWVLDSTTLEMLSQKAHRHPFKLKCVFHARELMSFEIGLPATPFFKDENTGEFKRRYQAEKRCYEVTFLDQINFARKTSCVGMMDDLSLPGLPDFKPITVAELMVQGLKGFSFWQNSGSFQLSGFLHSLDTIRMDQRVLGLSDLSPFPRQTFGVSWVTSGKVELDSKKGLIITQEYQFKMDRLGLLDARVEKGTHQIKRALNEWIYSDGRGKVILINQLLLPRALQNSQWILDQDHLDFLSDLEVRSKVEPVCFRDTWIGPGDQDCQRMIFGRARPVRVQGFDLLKLDFNAASVKE